MRIFSWNINGVRSAAKSGFLEWLSRESPDVLCLQETRCLPSDLEDVLISPFQYKSHWVCAQKRGYSGVSIYTKIQPLDVKEGIGVKHFDDEGRVQIAEFKEFVLLNCYFPNSRGDHSRLPYKLEFCEVILEKCKNLEQSGKKVVICGDFNIAHKEIDLANPETNINNAGFLPEERAWMEAFVNSHGYVDTFREFNKNPGQYTWWPNWRGLRERNIGWRIDYFAIDPALRPKLKEARIHPDVLGSDHCPVSIELV